jgi:hypothetical protein
VQVTTGSQWLTLPTERILVGSVAQVVTKVSQASNEVESEMHSSLYPTIAVPRFPPPDPLPVGAQFEKDMVYCIMEVEWAANVPR